MTVDDFLLNPEVLRSAYGYVPTIGVDTRVRSINLNWRGPSVVLRIDLPGFPESAPPEWLAAGVDTVQCHLQFIAVQNLSLRDWRPPTVARVEATPRESEKRLQIDVNGDGLDLSFDSSDSVLVGHVSAFRIGDDGSDTGPRHFTNRIDSRRFQSLPEPSEKTYYERA